MVGDWISWGASQRGTTHASLGIPCQDAWLSCHARWGDLAVVCDGMGSCREARRGALVACRAVVSAARMYSLQSGAQTEDLLRLIHAHWLFFLLPFAPRDCRTTCLFVLRCYGKILFAQLGDGMLITVRKGQARPVFSCNKDFSNVTTALGERFAAEQWQTMTKPESEVDTVLLTTDGMADEIDEARQEDFAIDLLAEVKMMDAHSRRIWLRNMLRKWTATPPSDDTTLVCLHRKKEEWTHVS